jgi:hypothetical protein
MRGRQEMAWLVAALAPWVAACGAATGIPDEAIAGHDSGSANGDAGGSRPLDATAVHPDRDASASDATRGDARDAAARDTGPDALPARDAALDGMLPLKPSELIAAHGLILYGVTDHGLIIYGEAVGTTFALPFTGGAPQLISPPSFVLDAGGGQAPSEGVWVSHDVVFMSGTEDAPLYAWTEASGTNVLPNPMGVPGGAIAIASADSRYVAYTWSDDLGTQYYLANVDGTDALYLGYGSVLFDGSKAVFGQQCISQCSDSVTAFDGRRAWAKVVLSPSAGGFVTDAIGANALLYQFTDAGASGELLLAPLDGGAPTLVDPNALGSAPYLSPSSDFALYLSGPPGSESGQPEAIVLPGGTPYALPTVSSSYVLGVYAARFDSPFGPIAALGTDHGNVIVGLGPDATVPNVTLSSTFFDGFTADASFALTVGSTAQDTSTLNAINLAGGSEPVVLSSTSLAVWSPLSGTTILFCDNFVAEGAAGGGVTDLRVADVAGASGSALVESGVTVFPDERAVYGLSPDHTQIAYIRSSGASTDGLYVTALPAGP